jgi:nitroreductase
VKVRFGQSAQIAAGHCGRERTLIDMSQTVSTSAREQIAFLRGLRQVRLLRPDPLPQAVLDDILEVARWTGSARNLQPWDLVLVRDRAMLQALARVEGGRAAHLLNAAAGIALVMNGNPEHFDFDTYDEGRLSERIMLAAGAHGVGSAIGWFKGAASDEAKRLLGVPSGRLLRTTMSLGYVDAEGHAQRSRPQQPRKPLSDMLRQEHW